jgi:hypothetical protein
MKRVEYFPKNIAEREAALVASPASGQAWDRPTAPGQFGSFAEEDSRAVSEVNFTRLDPPVGEFNLSRLERVIYGPGKIAALRDEMERRDLHRGLVVTTDVVAELPILKEVTGAQR